MATLTSSSSFITREACVQRPREGLLTARPAGPRSASYKPRQVICATFNTDNARKTSSPSSKRPNSTQTAVAAALRATPANSLRTGGESSASTSDDRRGLQWIGGCGSCATRREALIPLAILGTASALGRRGGFNTQTLFLETKSSEPQQQLWSDARFASLMRDGMIDYEAQIVPVKEALLSEHLLKGSKVVEVGMGTGPSLQYYRRAEVGSIVGVEPNLAMHPVAKEEAAKWGLGNKLKLVAGFAESLPFPDASVDVVVATMLLCSVQNMEETMREFNRVLKPGGRYVFIEHIGAPRGSALRALQTVFDPLQVATACGCHLTREPLECITSGIFDEVDATHFTLGQTLEQARAAPQRDCRGWQPGTAPPQHFLLSPHLAGVATKA